jgi:hypothetical protein
MRRAVLTITAAALALGAAAGAAATAQSPAGKLPKGGEKVNLDPADFSTRITNRWWPMRPGTRWVYRETDPEGSRQKVVVTVTDRTKLIASGVTARVVHDVVTEDGKFVEVTDDWYAQDKRGNIWYLGEATTEYENGKPVSTNGSFEAGVDGAQAGVIMPANPRPGLRYRQEYYRPALMTKDVNPLEPKVLELKFYARGVGPVLAVGVSGESDREELVRFKRGERSTAGGRG